MNWRNNLSHWQDRFKSHYERLSLREQLLYRTANSLVSKISILQYNKRAEILE